MQKRSLFLALTAGMLIWGFGALEARAETLTLSVFAGTDTTAPAIYSVVGGSTAVSADTGILNGNLAAAGFGAYSFSNLGGSSNNPGSSATGDQGGAFILTSGNLSVTPGGSGESTPITVVLTEGGFVLPTSSPSLVETGPGELRRGHRVPGQRGGAHGCHGRVDDPVDTHADGDRRPNRFDEPRDLCDPLHVG